MAFVAFDTITASFIPGSKVEFSNIRAVNGLPVAQHKLLIVGQQLASAAHPPLLPQRITTASQASNEYGRGSVLAAMVAAALYAAPDGVELWACGIADNGAGTAATKTITFTGPATGAGTIPLLLAGVKVPVAVASGDSATAIATAAVAAVTAQPDLPFTATNAAGVVTLTCRHKGTVGNDMDMRVNYYPGDQLPTGVTVAFAAGVTGATNPDVTTVWAAIGDEQYQYVALGMADAANLTSADTEFAARSGPNRQIGGRVFAAMSGSFSTCQAFGLTRNGIYTTVIGNYLMPTPPWKIAAMAAAVAGRELKRDPARPLTYLPLPGALSPAQGVRFTDTERNQLLDSGISTLKVLPGDVVSIERLITCYQLNAYGFEDRSYLDIGTLATLEYLRFSWRARMAAKFPRAKRNETTRLAVKAETIALAREWEEAELIDDVDGFIAGLIVEDDAAIATQFNLLMTPKIVGGLLQLAARIEFIL